MSTSVVGFFRELAFTNLASPVRDILNDPGLGTLDDTGVGYMVNPDWITDSRVPTTRSTDINVTQAPYILTDKAFCSQFLTDVVAAPQAVRDALFTLCDDVFLKFAEITNIETTLNSGAAKGYYVANSLLYGTKTVTDTYYTGTAGATYTSTPFATFEFVVPSGSASTTYNVTIYFDGATWLTNYPYSTILGVAPPLPYQDLLTMSISTTQANRFDTASSTARLNTSTLAAILTQENPSGYMSFNVGLIDGTTATTVPFDVVWRGIQPSQLQIREYIKEQALASGGTDAQWQARMPDLYINYRFYLLPLYNDTKTGPTYTLNTGITDVQTAIQTATTILNNMDVSIVEKSLEVFTSPYKRLVMLAVPDITDIAARVRLLSKFATYQCYGSTDTNFQYLDSDTKSFILNLGGLLSQMSSDGTDPLPFNQFTSNGLNYYSFTLSGVEYCVLTQASFEAKLEGTS